MTTVEKFNAAVNVIRNLPKNGPVQTSHHVMLKFYAYFKQATEGPNTSPKPPFWDLVRKAKWDAWMKLGNMDSETAMKLYVDEFKKIVETVSSSNTNMDKSEIDNFYASVPMGDLELLVGPVVAQSRSNSPVNEVQDSATESVSDINEGLKESAPIDVPVKLDVLEKREDKLQNRHRVYTNGSVRNEDEDDEEYFLDTIENSEPGSAKTRPLDDKLLRTAQFPYMNGYAICVPDSSNNNSNRRFYNEEHEANLHLTTVITCLQRDLEKVVNSVNLIEQRIGQLQGKLLSRRSSHSFSLSSPVVSFIILFSWPVLLQLLIYWFQRRREH